MFCIQGTNSIPQISQTLEITSDINQQINVNVSFDNSLDYCESYSTQTKAWQSETCQTMESTCLCDATNFIAITKTTGIRIYPIYWNEIMTFAGYGIVGILSILHIIAVVLLLRYGRRWSTVKQRFIFFIFVIFFVLYFCFFILYCATMYSKGCTRI